MDPGKWKKKKHQENILTAEVDWRNLYISLSCLSHKDSLEAKTRTLVFWGHNKGRNKGSYFHTRLWREVGDVVEECVRQFKMERANGERERVCVCVCVCTHSLTRATFRTHTRVSISSLSISLQTILGWWQAPKKKKKKKRRRKKKKRKKKKKKKTRSHCRQSQKRARWRAHFGVHEVRWAAGSVGRAEAQGEEGLMLEGEAVQTVVCVCVLWLSLRKEKKKKWNSGLMCVSAFACLSALSIVWATNFSVRLSVWLFFAHTCTETGKRDTNRLMDRATGCGGENGRKNEGTQENKRRKIACNEMAML